MASTEKGIPMKVEFNTERLEVFNMKAYHLNYMMEIYSNPFYSDATGVSKPVKRAELRQKYIEIVNHPKYFILIALDKEAFVGLLKGFYEHEKKALWISLVAIQESYLRQGYGKELVKGLENYFKSLKKCNISFISVKETNDTAKEFWQKIGYGPVGEKDEKVVPSTAIVYRKSIT